MRSKDISQKVVSMNNKFSLFMINKIETKINKIIEELTFLSKERDEESLIRLSELTQERDRLISKLEELQLQMKNENDLKENGSVGLGDCVTLRRGSQNMEVCLVKDYAIGSSSSAISTMSPLGKQLIDRRPGEKIEVETPGGTIEYKIVRIK